MEAIHYLNEEHIFIFLVQVFVLLSVAKVLGTLSMRLGYPALAGEILTGILLGPTILGRMLPGLHAAMFPPDIVQQNMLETVSWFGVLFLLLVTGFEVSISNASKQGKAALTIGIVGVIIPFIIGCLVFWWLPEKNFGTQATRLTFTLFLATAASISAMAVIARILHDLRILKSDLGVTMLSGFVVNDILGWLIFSIVLGLTATHQTDIDQTVHRLFTLLLFGTVCLTLGGKFIDHITRLLKHPSLPHPATILTFVTCLALLCGAITQWLGIHAILGFFLAGIMAGNSTEISERTREIITQMVHAIFVPIFFASIGLKVDFVNFNIPIVILFTLVAVGGKFIGAFIGARLGKLPTHESISMGIAFIPGGAMEIILGMLALELHLISVQVFIAIVFAALSSSILVGPLLSWSTMRKKIRICDYLSKNAIIPNMQAKNRWQAIAELCTITAENIKGMDPNLLQLAVIEREKIMGTGLEKGVAVPHGRIKELKEPVIAFGKSTVGIEWDTRDGIKSRYIFLILTPENKQAFQVQILAVIARCMANEKFQNQILALDDKDKIYELLYNELEKETLHSNR